ncbi:hypothetical protein I6A84_06230 [Frankia sp. CNm7]|uniref:Lipoprotein n=1 Tax=Frankia nepalensis TaxID=1836974 RepID=A0A937RJ41_9ACTN|nr:hypothetical protein [Frankia nepalensis]MBL7496220.1 hypothetical protein [Frankia nepalensis]MBL7511641.1 hypothetical protein [Frankia nepalensis]MBL7517734.1 hypothetical protein [Frankia nepalensis]MBL7631117.1 hypothetical protein [Frankia nepalensis]
MKIRMVSAALLAVVGVAAVTTGCSEKAKERGRDAPISTHDDSPARIINMPDGFSNVAAKCDGPNMVYVVYHGDSPYGSIEIAPNDPRCAPAGTTG